MDPAEVCRTAELPPGFQLQVFAAEPDVQNPIGLLLAAIAVEIIATGLRHLFPGLMGTA